MKRSNSTIKKERLYSVLGIIENGKREKTLAPIIWVDTENSLLFWPPKGRKLVGEYISAWSKPKEDWDEYVIEEYLLDSGTKFEAEQMLDFNSTDNEVYEEQSHNEQNSPERFNSPVICSKTTESESRRRSPKNHSKSTSKFVNSEATYSRNSYVESKSPETNLSISTESPRRSPRNHSQPKSKFVNSAAISRNSLVDSNPQKRKIKTGIHPHTAAKTPRNSLFGSVSDISLEKQSSGTRIVFDREAISSSACSSAKPYSPRRSPRKLMANKFSDGGTNFKEMSTKRFQYVVLMELSNIKERQLQIIEDQQLQNEAAVADDDSLIVSAETMEEFDLEDKKLEQKNYFKKKKIMLKQLGGSSARNHVMRALDSIMTRGLQKSFSKGGTEHKRAFNKTKQYKVLAASISDATKDGYTIAKIDFFISDLLKRAKRKKGAEAENNDEQIMQINES